MTATKDSEQFYPNGRFKPGNTVSKLGGRPKGARNKLGEAFIEALHNDFQEKGIEAIKEVREEKPDQYLKVIAQVIPQKKEIDVNPSEDLTDLSDAIQSTVNFLSKFALEAKQSEEEDFKGTLPN